MNDGNRSTAELKAERDEALRRDLQREGDDEQAVLDRICESLERDDADPGPVPFDAMLKCEHCHELTELLVCIGTLEVCGECSQLFAQPIVVDEHRS